MIAFDIDGCVNSIKDDIIRLGAVFFSEYGIKPRTDGYYLRQIYPGAPEKLYDEFWQKHGYEIYTNPPIENVCKTISLVREKNMPACYITTRNTQTVFNGVTLGEITEKWLKKYDIELPVYYTKDKASIVRKLGIKLMIEDKPANITALQPHTNVLIFLHPYNEKMDGTFVQNWKDIENIIFRKTNS